MPPESISSMIVSPSPVDWSVTTIVPPTYETARSAPASEMAVLTSPSVTAADKSTSTVTPARLVIRILPAGTPAPPLSADRAVSSES